MRRKLSPELLDALPSNDPRAIRSRRELRRVNAWMGNARWLAGALRPWWRGGDGSPRVVTDLGTGDGWVTWSTLHRVTRGGRVEAGSWLNLVDQQPVVAEPTLERFRSRGWKAVVLQDDAERALSRSDLAVGGAVMANLFLHHFEDAALRGLLAAAARACRWMVACEPRRSPLALWGARLLGCIGCGAVTRHDARVSVEAGFRDGELSALWPAEAGWRVEERRVGPFSHLFLAWREGRSAV
jgi:hypothetical protein